MENNTKLQKPDENKQVSVKQFFRRDDVNNKFAEILKTTARSKSFIASLMQVVNSSEQLEKADPTTIMNAAITAATMELPINNQLGFAYIVPFYNSKKKQYDGQFMIGYKGFIQLALRSGQFKKLSATPVYEGQLTKQNPLTGFEFDWSVKAVGKPIGYAAYFELINGFEKTTYATLDQVEAHAKKFSQTFKKGFGLWKDDFESMALKTVIKLLLSKYALLSVEMQKAVLSDQAIINDEEATDFTYVDNEVVVQTKEEKESDTLLQMIDECTSIEDLENYERDLKTDEHTAAYTSKMTQLIEALPNRQ